MTLMGKNADKVDETIAAIRTVIPDFRRTELHLNVGHESGHYFDNLGNLRAQPGQRRLQRRAGRERRPELDALRGAERFDPEDALEVRHHRRQPPRPVRRHRHVVLLVGAGRRRMGQAGVARCLFSLISAAVVTSAIMNPEFSPGAAVRKGGRS